MKKPLLCNKDLEYNWGREASRLIREKMIKEEVTYKRLVQLLRRHSLRYNPKQLQNKLSRGTLTAGIYVLVNRLIDEASAASENEK